MTTVAASTVAPYAGTVVLGNGKKYAGISTTVSGTVGPARLVTARSVRRASASGGGNCLCAGHAQSRQAAGKIVVCDRGVIPRADKSAEVKRAGGKGMVLVNLTEVPPMLTPMRYRRSTWCALRAGGQGLREESGSDRHAQAGRNLSRRRSGIPR